MSRHLLFALLDRVHYLFGLIAVVLINVLYPQNNHILLIVGFALYIIAAEVFFYIKAKDTRRISSDVLSTLSLTAQERIQAFPLPVIICEQNGDIVWYDEKYLATVSEASARELKNVKTIDSNILSRPMTDIFFDQKHFAVYNDVFLSKDEKKHILYLVDNTEFVNLQRTYNISRPVIAHVLVDNYDELFQKAKENEKTSTMALIDLALSNWGQSVGGLIRKTGNNRYLFLFKSKDLSTFTENRFSILDTIRNLDISLPVAPTLSIGIGFNYDSFSENEEEASEALKTALARGGDQAAVKLNGKYTFFGGNTKGVEKLTKVGARVESEYFRELLKTVDNVLVMGHQYSDFDSLGACIGVAHIARKFAKRVGIVYNPNSSLAGVLYDDLVKSPEIASYFINSEDAMMLDMERTLVCVVDTHRASYTVLPDLLKFARHTAVIDHHRKAGDAIENAEFFFHEPNASSVCEMITELLPYLDINHLPEAEAEALLAGICLDTKNFTLRTSSYTFEASSFLRRSGADPVNIKRFFQTDMDAYIKRAQMVQNAEIYRETFAIALWHDPVDVNEFRIIASQAADEMLNIEGVNASFAVFCDEKSDTVHISGRSLGLVNVQLIAEKLGGGGHQTMAAAQLHDTEPKEAVKTLKLAINKFLEENKQA